MHDKKATGTLSQQSNGFQQDAAAAVAQLLGPGTSIFVEIAVKAKGLPDRDVLRCGGCAWGCCIAAVCIFYAPLGCVHRLAPQETPTRPPTGLRQMPTRSPHPPPKRSKSDAMGVLLASEGYGGKTWSEVGRTDTVANSLNPEFRKPLRVTYNFEKLQPMRVCGRGREGLSVAWWGWRHGGAAGSLSWHSDSGRCLHTPTPQHPNTPTNQQPSRSWPSTTWT